MTYNPAPQGQQQYQRTAPLRLGNYKGKLVGQQSATTRKGDPAIVLIMELFEFAGPNGPEPLQPDQHGRMPTRRMTKSWGSSAQQWTIKDLTAIGNYTLAHPHWPDFEPAVREGRPVSLLVTEYTKGDGSKGLDLKIQHSDQPASNGYQPVTAPQQAPAQQAAPQAPPQQQYAPQQAPAQQAPPQGGYQAPPQQAVAPQTTQNVAPQQQAPTSGIPDYEDEIAF